jgi:hypothetical protein
MAAIQIPAEKCRRLHSMIFKEMLTYTKYEMKINVRSGNRVLELSEELSQSSFNWRLALSEALVSANSVPQRCRR